MPGRLRGFRCAMEESRKLLVVDDDLAMREMLASPEVWPLLEKHFAPTRQHRSWLARLRSSRA